MKTHFFRPTASQGKFFAAAVLLTGFIVGNLPRQSLAATVPGCVPPPSGLVSWWAGEGNANDVADGNHGILQGEVSFAPGKVGQAFVFNTNNVAVRIAASSNLNVGVGSGLTIEAWINPSDVIAFHPIVEWNSPTDPSDLVHVGVHLHIGRYPGDHGVLHLNLIDTAGNSHILDSQADTVVANVFQHVALTYDKTTGAAVLYVNGTVVAQANLGSFVPQTTYDLWVSRRPGDYPGSWTYNSFFAGLLDELCLYNRALSQAEIQAIYNASSAGKCAATPAVPVITSFNPIKGPVGTTVTITGLNFSPTPADNIVYFGAVKAVVTAASAMSLTVTVPVGATYAPITETVNGLTAYANAPFMPTFPGGGTIDSSSFAPRVDLGAGHWPYRVAIGDLDGDGKPDLIAANVTAYTISVYRNISTNGSLAAGSFAPRLDLPVPVGGESPTGLRVADLDGDGKLDIVIANNTANSISIFKNISAPGNITSNSFAPRVDFPAGAGTRDLAVRDLDGDGKPDIVTANFGGGTVSVLRNTSTVGGITTNSFTARVDFAAGGGAVCAAIEDLDGDGKSDLITANYNDGTVSVLRNLCSVGSITTNSFAPKINLPGLSYMTWVAIGDLDGDGKQDLAAISYHTQTLSVFRNTSAVGSLTTNSFAPRVGFPTGGRGHTVAIGDLDGDGKPDLALVTELPSHLSVYRNMSTPGSFTTSSLAGRVDYSSGWNAWGVAIGDLDGDGKPDIVFANQYDDTISIYRNVMPFGVPPAILTQPAGQAVTVGEDAHFAVVASGTPPLSHQWRFNGADIADATNAMFMLANVQLADAGDYSVVVGNAFGSVTSSNATLRVNQYPIADASATPTSYITCNGSNTTVILDGSRSSDPDGDPLQYLWYEFGVQEGPLAVGAVTATTLTVGSHNISLVVHDGFASDTNGVTVTVLTPALALQRLIALVEMNAARPTPLGATLHAALASIDRVRINAAINQLQAFQNQVSAQLSPIDQASAAELTQAAQQIIDALLCMSSNARPPGKIKSVGRAADGKVRLQLDGAPGTVYVVEATSDLKDWEMIGVVLPQEGGTFVFEDPSAAQHSSRFYRLVLPWDSGVGN